MTKLNFVDFSRNILTSGDIDPDYIYIREKSDELKWDDRQRFEWIKLKVVVYDSCSELSILHGRETLETAKYGAERRKAKRRAAEYRDNINRFFNGVDVEKFFTRSGPRVFDDIRTIKGFGSWAAWKLMDLVDSVFPYKVDFEGIDFRKAYEFPLKGMCLVAGLPEDVKLLADDNVYNACMDTVRYEVSKIGDVPTPHNGGKGIRMNEIETLLCKFHSHYHGHYRPGQDLEHLNHRRIESGWA